MNNITKVTFKKNPESKRFELDIFFDVNGKEMKSVTYICPKTMKATWDCETILRQTPPEKILQYLINQQINKVKEEVYKEYSVDLDAPYERDYQEITSETFNDVDSECE